MCGRRRGSLRSLVARLEAQVAARLLPRRAHGPTSSKVGLCSFTIRVLWYECGPAVDVTEASN
jgi:hypothetical protein